MPQVDPARYDGGMAGCVLRVSGRAFQVDAFLAASSLAACKVWHLGERRFGSRPATLDCGFNSVVSEAGDLRTQVSDALLFLQRHHADLLRLSAVSEVEDLVLDFGISLRDVAGQFERIPLELIRAAGELRMSFELSHYAVGDD